MKAVGEGMFAFKLLGKDFIPPDLEAKVVGGAKYLRILELMEWRLLRFLVLPHAKVKNIDLSKAMKAPGFLAAAMPVMSNNLRVIANAEL